MDVRAPRIPIVANVTGELYPETKSEIVDLLGRQVASPVQFVKGIETLYREGVRILVEVGPKRVLNALAGDILQDRDDVTILYTNHPRKGALPSLNEALCGLYAAGVGTTQPMPAPRVETHNTSGLSRFSIPLPKQQAAVQPPSERQTTTVDSVQKPQHNMTAPAAREPAPSPLAAQQGTDDGRYMALGRLFADFLEQGSRIYGGQVPAGQPSAAQRPAAPICQRAPSSRRAPAADRFGRCHRRGPWFARTGRARL